MKWRFRRMDLWVLIFMLSIGLSETLREGNPKDGIILWMEDFIEMFFAYVVGRQLIEPNLRLETIKRVIFLFICQTPMALYEYRFGVKLLDGILAAKFLVSNRVGSFSFAVGRPVFLLALDTQF